MRAKNFYIDSFSFDVIWYGGNDIGWCELQQPIIGCKLGLNLIPDENYFISGSGALTLEITDLNKEKQILTSKKMKTTYIHDIPNMTPYLKTFDSENYKIQIISKPRVN